MREFAVTRHESSVNKAFNTNGNWQKDQLLSNLVRADETGVYTCRYRRILCLQGTSITKRISGIGELALANFYWFNRLDDAYVLEE